MGLRLLYRREPRARASLRHPPGSAGPGVWGTARLDRRTKRLVARLKPGNVAILDHDDLDRVAAEALLECGVAAVVNAGRSITGRYPNLGPLLLARAGVPILDNVGQRVFELVEEGDVVQVVGDSLLCGDRLVARGEVLDERTIRARMDAAKASLSQTVERFAENTLDYVRQEQNILLEGVRMPQVRTSFRGRHALVVTRGYHYKEDLRALRTYVKEMKPVVIAVDGAADACLQEGIVPDLIVGDMDSVSTAALACGAELLVHPPGEWRRQHPDGTAEDDPPGVQAIRALGLPFEVITAPGTSEDVAMLLADEKGAELVVTVGSHTSMVEFLDKGRKGMASTFLVRLRLGPKLVDAKGVSQLYRTRVRTRDLVLLVGAAVVTMGIATAVTPPGRLFWTSAAELLTQLVFRIKQLF